MKTGLVLSGGGSRGAFTVGVIESLRNKGITFDFVSGTSTGSIIAPLISIDDISSAVDNYSSVNKSDILRKNWRRFFWDGLHDMSPLRKRIISSFSEIYKDGLTRWELLQKSKCRSVVCAVNLQTKKTEYFSQTGSKNITKWKDIDMFADTIIASSSEPFYMKPQNIEGYQYLDGGLREVVPINNLKDIEKLDRVFVVLTTSESEKEIKKFSSIPSIITRSIEIMLDEIILNDVKSFQIQNEMASYINSVKNKLFRNNVDSSIINSCFKSKDFQLNKKDIEIIVIRPEDTLPDVLDFGPDLMKRSMKLGNKATNFIE